MVKTVFDPRLAQELLRPNRFGWRVRYQPSCDSTQARARHEVESGAGAGLVIVTDHQLQGRGRQGASWSDATGTALLFSVALQRESTPTVLPLLAGVCVADAIEELTGLPSELKWPNDVLLRDLKLAGILAEASKEHVILGIGVNVNTPRIELPAGAISIAAEINRWTSRERLLAAILEQLRQKLEHAGARGPAWVVDQWKARSSMLGEAVRAFVGREQLEGVAEDVDESGRLWIRRPDGTREALVAGEVRRLRPAH